MAREYTKSNTKYDPFTNTRLNDITFKELFGAFKVVKAVEHAKKYSSVP